MPESDFVDQDAVPEDASAEDASAEEAEADLSADLVALSKERDELRGVAQRLQADFENYRKRMLREQTENDRPSERGAHRTAASRPRQS